LFLFLNREKRPLKTNILILVVGAITLHSIIAAPFVGAFFAFLLWKIFKQLSWGHAFVYATLIVIFGHPTIDFFGNGLALFYPFTYDEYVFDIINDSSETVIIILLLLGLCLSLLQRKGRAPILISMGVVVLMVATLGINNAAIYNRLNKQLLRCLLSADRFIGNIM
jgi:membrane-bound metal-dependent hydrolase YbcI (DUF457 family)